MPKKERTVNFEIANEITNQETITLNYKKRKITEITQKKNDTSTAKQETENKVNTTKLKKLIPGDLVFFKTGRGRKITHVGIVVSNNKDYPEFIHSSTSRGVIISSLGEAYWRKNFRKARRIIH